MELIDKSKVVAEIERRLKELAEFPKFSYEIGLIDAYKIMRAFLDTLEVKEADLDDKDKWKNTGGFGSTWDPDSPDYYPD